MPDQTECNVAASFENIHSIITRGLQVSTENVQEVLQHGFQNEGRRKGLFNYVRALSSVVNAHHLTEDEVAFPYFRDKLPEVSFDGFTYFHGVMVGVLGEINQALEICEKIDRPGTEFSSLEDPLVRLSEMWPVHIQYEASDFISKADALISVEEQLKLVGRMAEHDLKNAGPHPLTVPFMLYNLHEENRAIFSQGMPLEFVQESVPVVWKAQWESMAPYLLV